MESVFMPLLPQPYSPGPALPRPFAIAGLGFCATPAAGFARLGAATTFATGLFATAALDFAVLRCAFLGLALTHIFFTALLAADVASHFFSGSSNAGLGTTRSWGPNLLISAAGFTPAAMAVLAAAGLNAARRHSFREAQETNTSVSTSVPSARRWHRSAKFAAPHGQTPPQCAREFPLSGGWARSASRWPIPPMESALIAPSAAPGG